MKRNLLIAAIALLAVAFVSCQKDGVYKPKKKIAKIYSETIITTVASDASSSTTKTDSLKPYVAEEWTWGDKTLTSVVNKDKDGKVTSTVNYTYDDKNRLTGSTCGSEKAEFAYNDDKKLQSIKITDGDHSIVMEITYADKLPASIKTVDSYTMKNLSTFAKSIIPSYISEAIEANQMRSKATFSTTYNTTIEWDDKNISQVVTTGEGDYKYTATYEYDSKLNPYKGMYGDFEDNNFDVQYSKNNVVKKTVNSTDGHFTDKDVAEYTYEYDGKMPLKVTYSYTDEEEILGVNYKRTYVNVRTYEYTK